MQRVVRENQAALLPLRQPARDKIEVEPLVAAVDLVANEGMAQVRQVNAELVFAAGERKEAQQSETTSGFREAADDDELRLRRRTIGAHAIHDRYTTLFVLAKRRVNQTAAFAQMAVNDGEVFFLDCPALEDSSQFTGGFRGLGDEHDPAGFAVEPVDKAWRDIRSEMRAHATDQAGVAVGLGRMTNQARRLVDHQQVGVFVQDVEQAIHDSTV